MEWCWQVWGSQGSPVLCYSAGGGELCSCMAGSAVGSYCCHLRPCSVSPGPWQLSCLFTKLSQMWGNLSLPEVKLTGVICVCCRCSLHAQVVTLTQGSVWSGYPAHTVHAAGSECVRCHWPCHYPGASSELQGEQGVLVWVPASSLSACRKLLYVNAPSCHCL